MFEFLFRKRKENTGCKCNSFSDQDLEEVETKNMISMFEFFLASNNYEYEIIETLLGRKFIIDDKIVSCIDDNDVFRFVCLSCRHNIGWNIKYIVFHTNKDLFCAYPYGVVNIDRFFEEIIQDHIKKTKKQKKREKLAHEICGC